MKNFVILLVSIFTFATAFNSTAQSMQTATETNTLTTNPGDFEILTNFKATKEQKRVIKKIKKYVSPRILGGAKYTTALEGKTVKVQMNFDDNGNIANVMVLENELIGADQKVIDLIKEYDAKYPIATSDIEKPSAIQLDIDLVAKKYTLR